MVWTAPTFAAVIRLPTRNFLTPYGHASNLFSHVVANFRIRSKSGNGTHFVTINTEELSGYGLPAKKNADYAFILHINKSLNDHGKAGIVVPHGVLFKSRYNR